MSENRIVVYSCGRNCQQFIVKHISSILIQDYTNYEHTVIDDASDDNTYHLALDFPVKLNRNTIQLYHLQNEYRYIHPKDDDIVMIVDLDDWLLHSFVFRRINEIYNKTDCWLTYGSMLWRSSLLIEGKEYPEVVKQNKLYREYEWLCIHPLTFRGFLWNNIDKTSFLDSNGDFLTTCADMAKAFPMLEMCRPDKICFISELLYVYNDMNSNCVMYIDKEKQKANELYIRNMKRYNEV
jgi:glycosyltransferase involved in cell wall biosynthesis